MMSPAERRLDRLQRWKSSCARKLARAGGANERRRGVVLTLCLVRLEMLLDMAWSQSKQSSAVENWTTPLQTPSTATTWKAFFLEAETGKNFQKRF